MIKCITFDLDDTLWAVDPVVKAANQTLFDWLYENAPLFHQQFTLRDLGTLRQQALAAEPEISYSVTRIRKAVLKLGLAQAGYSEQQVAELSDAAFDVFLRARQNVVFFEHALKALADLKTAGYQLGAITNGNADIHRTGLSSYLDFQFSADHVGVEKPDAKIFTAMLHHTKLKPENVIHIGDNPQHDVLGAKSAGLWGVWVNLYQQPWRENVAPDATVTSLDQLVGAVGKIAACKRARL